MDKSSELEHSGCLATCTTYQSTPHAQFHWIHSLLIPKKLQQQIGNIQQLISRLINVKQSNIHYKYQINDIISGVSVLHGSQLTEDHSIVI